MNVKCIYDDDFVFDRRVDSACNSVFDINDEDIYGIRVNGYFDDIIEQYYTICPICGHIVLLDDKDLSLDVREKAMSKNEEIPYLYELNNVMSEFINLKSKSNKAKKKVRTL